MFHQAKIITVGLTITGIFLLVSVMSCDTKKHRKIMTFFFDGVPPLDSELTQAEEPQGGANVESGMKQQTPKQAAPTGSEHEPWRKCSGECHGRRTQKSFSRQVYLSETIPALCYKCHTDYTTSAVFVHGPVVTGDCLFCHGPHRSKNKHLLKSPVPELCFQCHEKDVVDSIPNHAAESAAKCNKCHEAHASSVKTLLKTGLKDKLIEE